MALAERIGWLHLYAPYDVLGAWWVIAIIAVLLIVEVIADKIPAVDHVNDVIQTLVRPAAGGLLAVSSSGHGSVSPIVLLVAGVLIAGGVHAVKATARPVVNVSTAGAGAPVVSTLEDIGAVIVTVLALVVPVLAAIVIITTVVLAIVMIRRWRRHHRAAQGRT